MRDLTTMATARQESDWNHTAAMICATINSSPHFGKGRKKTVSFDKCHPFRKAKRKPKAKKVSRAIQEASLDAVFREP